MMDGDGCGDMDNMEDEARIGVEVQYNLTGMIEALAKMRDVTLAIENKALSFWS